MGSSAGGNVDCGDGCICGSDAGICVGVAPGIFMRAVLALCNAVARASADANIVFQCGSNNALGSVIQKYRNFAMSQCRRIVDKLTRGEACPACTMARKMACTPERMPLEN